MNAIEQPYTLFIEIPVFSDGKQIYADPLWAKDLALHLDYIRQLYLCCPVEPLSKAPDGVVVVEGLHPSRLFPLRRTYGAVSILKTFFPNFVQVAKALRRTEIAHSGGAGWPFPLTFYMLALSPFIKFKWVVLIESSFWMKPKEGRVTVRQKVRHVAYRSLLRASLKRAHARIFTTVHYRKFFGIARDRVLIAPAVWVDEGQIISTDAQRARLSALPNDRVAFLFPARLVPEKGVDVILSAIRELEQILPDDAPKVSIDIVGKGPLLERCKAFASSHTGRVTIRVLDHVPYPDGFFRLLRGYHATLLANRQDEQPRVVFDSFSQGVPVIASATAGVAEIVEHASNALLYDVGDAKGLANAAARLCTDSALLSEMSANAFMAARGSTHKAMHATRFEFFKDILL